MFCWVERGVKKKHAEGSTMPPVMLNITSPAESLRTACSSPPYPKKPGYQDSGFLFLEVYVSTYVSQNGTRWGTVPEADISVCVCIYIYIHTAYGY